MTVRFVPNRSAPAELLRSADMGRFLGHIADTAAAEAQSRLPYPTEVLGGITVKGSVDTTAQGAEGRVVVSGAGWHLWEFGTKNHAPRPAIRPGVQAVIERFGGRWKSQ